MFKLISKTGRARRGEYVTRHGVIRTPVFMNVATQAAIKGALSSVDLKTVGCQVALSNTYHLHIRPGDELIKSLGGLHKFMAWDGPILTDSGGFQIFSLANLRKITEEGVAFNSHVDGRKTFMSPEDCIRIQSNLGSDIAMAFDECIEIPSPRDYVEKSCDRTYNWLVRCKDELERQASPRPDLFGINQGAEFEDLRISHMKRIAELDLPGYAIGGLAVGETTQQMYEIVEKVEEHMPEDRPRYLMGVGTPLNIIECVARGIDFFDCVMPARNGRHGRLYTWGGEGSININNEAYKDDSGPIDDECDCPVCNKFSRAYIRHLFRAGEMLAMRLSVMHNLYYYNTLMARIRETIENGTFGELGRRYAAY
jgi:queuine tRNA-ribosyltransferase